MVAACAKKRRRSKDRRRKIEPGKNLLLLRLRGQIFESEAKEFADTRVFFLRVLFQHCALVRGDANGDLAMRNRIRLAALKIKIFHCKADNFTGRCEAVTITSRFDLRDQSEGEIKRQGSGAFLCASGHKNSKQLAVLGNRRTTTTHGPRSRATKIFA